MQPTLYYLRISETWTLYYIHLCETFFLLLLFSWNSISKCCCVMFRHGWMDPPPSRHSGILYCGVFKIHEKYGLRLGFWNNKHFHSSILDGRQTLRLWRPPERFCNLLQRQDLRVWRRKWSQRMLVRLKDFELYFIYSIFFCKCNDTFQVEWYRMRSHRQTGFNWGVDLDICWVGPRIPLGTRLTVDKGKPHVSCILINDCWEYGVWKGRCRRSESVVSVSQ